MRSTFPNEDMKIFCSRGSHLAHLRASDFFSRLGFDDASCITSEFCVVYSCKNFEQQSYQKLWEITITLKRFYWNNHVTLYLSESAIWCHAFGNYIGVWLLWYGITHKKIRTNDCAVVKMVTALISRQVNLCVTWSQLNIYNWGKCTNHK